ncbi:MAG: FeoA family protein [Thermodesulfobacteriota bacterium]
MIPLGLLSPGERAEIADVGPLGGCGSGCGKKGSAGSRVEDVGLRAGKVVEMLTNGSGGPILLKVDESRIALGRGVAMKILVRRQS